VAGNGWKTTAIGNIIRTKEELFEFQEQWEADADERSELFRLATMLVAQDDWEADTQRTELFKFVKMIVEQEDWEDSPERSALFDVCWYISEQEEWEQDISRSELFKVAAAQLENISDDDSSEGSDRSDHDTLVLPPHWSRNQFNTLRAGVVPLATVVVEETNYQKGAVSKALEMPGSPAQPKGELQGSPCNVAAMWDAFALPALELAHS
jgi:hypothetical protein